MGGALQGEEPLETREKEIRQIDGVALEIALVLGVARLGETDLRGWWRSRGFGQAGRYILGRAFRTTWRHAAMELDIVSAARLHDEALGRPTALHLFSDQLPFRRQALAWLAEAKTGDGGDLLDRLGDWTAEAALSELKSWTGPVEASPERIAGGLRLGTIRPEELNDADALPAIATALASGYLDQHATLYPPYLDVVR